MKDNNISYPPELQPLMDHYFITGQDIHLAGLTNLTNSFVSEADKINKVNVDRDFVVENKD